MFDITNLLSFWSPKMFAHPALQPKALKLPSPWINFFGLFRLLVIKPFWPLNILWIFLKVGTSVGCILSLFVVLYMHFHIISGMKALSTNRAATSQCSGLLRLARHLVRVFGCMAPSTAIALISSSNL